MRIISGKSRGTKLNTIDSSATRPTTDRVKESLFNIIRNYIEDAKVLDLFAGSGALGIECISRGCAESFFCDNSAEAIKMVEQNIKKIRAGSVARVLKADYKQAIEKFENEKFDIIFIDPPYRMNIATDAIERIVQKKILNKNGIIILETDEKEREIRQLENINIEIYDTRKYGKINLIFLCAKGE